MLPVYTPVGGFAGWLMGNVIYSIGTSGMSYVRDDKVYSEDGYDGELRYMKDRFVWVR